MKTTKIILTSLCLGLLAASTLRGADSPPTYLFSIGPLTGALQFSAVDVGVDTNANIYVLDGPPNYRVLKFSRQGDFVGHWGSFGSENGQFYNPVALALDAANNVYVVDRDNHRVTKFTSSGAYVRQFGTAGGGSGSGRLNSPAGVAVDASGNVYVADVGNVLIQKFTSAGTFSAQWRFLADFPSPSLDVFNPFRLAVDTAANVYLSESYSFDANVARLEKFSSSGALRTRWGVEGSGPGQFSLPAGLAIDRSNNVYVADSGNNRIQRFSTNGVFLSEWGSAGNGPGQFDAPYGVAVDRSGNLVYVADSTRIQVFAYSNAGPPLILRQPVSQPLSVGANVSFSVEAFGALPLSYQWRRNTTNLPGATSPTFSLNPAGRADAGTYSVLVTNNLGSVLSSNATLVLAAPFAATLPAAVRSASGAVLAGLATPNSDTATAWFEWGTNASYGNIAGTTNLAAGGSVVFASAASSGLSLAPDYHCRLVVSNSVGVARGADQVFALGRKVISWGDSFILSPELAPQSRDVVAIAAGAGHGLALKNDGTVVGWGYNGLGQTNVPPGLSNVIAIAAGEGHSLALKSDGTVVGWGDNGVQQIDFPANLGNVVAISASYGRSFALKGDGTVTTSVGGYVLPGLSNVVASIASGFTFDMALKNDGKVVAWGDNGNGLVSGAEGLSNVIAIAAGNYHGLALKQDGTVAIWGGVSEQQTNFTASLSNVVAVSAKGSHSLALKSDGTVVGWDINFGDLDAIPVGLRRVVAVAAAPNNTLALIDVATPLAFPDINVTEEDSGTVNAVFTLTLDGVQAETVSVDFTTSDGAALAGSDYVATNGTLVFTPGETSKTITLSVTGDVLDESVEEFYVYFNTPTNLALLDDQLVLFIEDNDDAPTITSQPQSQVVRANFDATFRVTAAGSLPLFYQWRRNGIDISDATNRTLTVTNVQTVDDGSLFTVLVSTNLSGWTALGSAVELTPGHFEFTDTEAPGHPTRFYQLRSP